jgi:hypothetical protein
MRKTLFAFGTAALLLTGVSTASFATGAGADPSQVTTEVQTGSQQIGRPATGGLQTPSGSYSMSTNGGVNANTGPGSAYSGTAQTTPDASNPTLASPSGGGASDGGSGGSGNGK